MGSAKPATPRRGKIVTFYSYKGGVGRSMALAAVAWILASNGKRVLVVDWDLEAPGLEYYFWPDFRDIGISGHPAQGRGVVELIEQYRDDVESRASMLLDGTPAAGDNQPRTLEGARRAVIEQDGESIAEDRTFLSGYTTETDTDDLFSGQGLIDFVPAGERDREYAKRLSKLDWNHLYRDLGGQTFFERLRGKMARAYDFILIDSRTGASDISGTCTKVMPDVVVVCFGLNNQGINSAAEVLEDIHRYPREIDTLPVPCRVDHEDEGAAERARVRYQDPGLFPAEFVNCHPDYVGAYWDKAEIPYSTSYAFHETPPIRDVDGDPLAAFEFIATNIAREPMWLQPTSEPDKWNSLVAGFAPPPVKLGYTHFVVSHARHDELWAQWIAWLLRNHNLSVRLQPVDQLEYEFLNERLVDAEGDPASRRDGGLLCVLTLLSSAYADAPYAESTWRWAWERRTRTSPARNTLLPVKIGEMRRIPSYLKEVRWTDLSELDRDQARRSLLSRLSDNLLAQAEAGISPEPVFPGDLPATDRIQDYWRRIEDSREKGDEDSGSRIYQHRRAARILERSNSLEMAAEHLDKAFGIASRRNDLLAIAAVGFESVYLMMRNPQQFQPYGAHAKAARRAESAVGAISDLVAADVAHITGRGWVTLSDSDVLRDQLEDVAAAMDNLAGDRPTNGRNMVAELAPADLNERDFLIAKACVSRLLKDYKGARRTLLHVRSRPDVDRRTAVRCDFEMGIGAFRQGKAAWDYARQRLEGVVASGAADAETTLFYARSTLGGIDQERGNHRRARQWFIEALDGLGSSEGPAGVHGASRGRTARRVLANVNLGYLAALMEGSSAEQEDSLGKAADYYREAVKIVKFEDAWPLVSLPLARAYREVCMYDAYASETDRLSTTDYYMYLLRAMWIYDVLGFYEDRKDVRSEMVGYEPSGQLMRNFLGGLKSDAKNIPDKELIDYAAAGIANAGVEPR
jgi:cellulose biosynthesis protein BcsQ